MHQILDRTVRGMWGLIDDLVFHKRPYHGDPTAMECSNILQQCGKRARYCDRHLPFSTRQIFWKWRKNENEKKNQQDYLINLLSAVVFFWSFIFLLLFLSYYLLVSLLRREDWIRVSVLLKILYTRRFFAEQWFSILEKTWKFLLVFVCTMYFVAGI